MSAPETTRGISLHRKRYVIRPSFELSDAELLIADCRRTGETPAQVVERLVCTALRGRHG